MSATGEPQSLARQPDFLELAMLLPHRVAGDPIPHSFIYEVSVYSAPPEVLVRGRDPALGSDGKEAWYFCSPVDCHQSAERRNRQVAGGGPMFWHSEGGTNHIQFPDGESVGAYWRTLSYVRSVRNQPGTAARKRFKKVRQGWCMVEIGLDKHDGAAGQQWEICKVYRSTSRQSTADPADTSTATAGAEDVGPAAGTGISGVEIRQHVSGPESGAVPEESLGVPVGGTPCPRAPPPASCDDNVHSAGVGRRPALRIGPASRQGTLAIVKKGNASSVPAAVVMKFDGSSILSAERMKEIAKLVLSSENPVVVLSAMGDTTSNIRLAAVKALSCDTPEKVSEIPELAVTKELHLRTVRELGLDSSIVSGSLDRLESCLQCVTFVKALAHWLRDCLVSFGQRASTEMFTEYLNKLGKETLQEWELCSVTTYRRDGGDMTTTTIDRALELKEIQIWGVDGVYTCDPKVCANAKHVPYLTFDEAAELRYICKKSIQIAMEGGIEVIVKNLYNLHAVDTVITKTRDMSESTLTSIALTSNTTIMEIERTCMLDQKAFIEKANSFFQIFEYLSIAVEWVANSQGKMWFTLVPSKPLSQELIQPELDKVVKELKKIATVDRLQEKSVISLIGNPQMSTGILVKALSVLHSSHVAAEVSQGLSKVKVSLVVDDSEAKRCVELLHSAFFELNDDSPAIGNTFGVARSGSKRKVDDGHLEDPSNTRKEMTGTGYGFLKEFEGPVSSTSSENDPELTNLLQRISSENVMPASTATGELNFMLDVVDCGLFEVHGPMNFFGEEPTIYRSVNYSLRPERECRRARYSNDAKEPVPPQMRVYSQLCLAFSNFKYLEELGISVNWVATSEGKMSFRLVPSKLLRQELIQPALDKAVKELQNFGDVRPLLDRSVTSLKENPERASNVVTSSHAAVEKVSQGSPQAADVSSVAHDSDAERCVQISDSAFVEKSSISEVKGPAKAVSKLKQKMGQEEVSKRDRRLTTRVSRPQWRY